ncbi:putative carboxylesterase [Mariannaea sp. PMI_226]|nr:putative carboxylesterase [Mariannaea sp. PMI_226]
MSMLAGDIHGGLCSGDDGAKFFKSIPYAKPPVGSLRFQPPKAYTGKYPGGSLNGSVIPAACIQFGDLFVEEPPYSEDCLYLDVWAPANASSSSGLPVKVWIYGGGNSAGGISDSFYDGCKVAEADAVFVSINYRLGPLGFLALDSAGVPGNQGISDILLGLQWVQDNIAEFGGDPKKVLLHGQSAGSTDVFTVATLPQAPRLINAAIMQSGGGRDIQGKVTAQRVGSDFVKALNCSVSDTECLTGKSVSDIQKAVRNTPGLNAKSFPLLVISNAISYEFQPHVDGTVIPVQPSNVTVKVPSIFGSTSREGAILALLQYSDAPKGPASATEADYQKFLSQNFGSNIAAMIEERYPVAAFNSTPFPAFYAMSAILGYTNYVCTAHRGLQVATSEGKVPVWAYNFAHTPHCPWLPSLPESALKLVGPSHTADIPFVFAHTEHLPIGNSSCSMTTEEKSLSHYLVDAWTNMAAHGEPKGDWPQYKNDKESQGINIGSAANDSSATPVPGYVNYTGCAFWDQVNQMLEAQENNQSSSVGQGTNSTNAASMLFGPRGGLYAITGNILLSVFVAAFFV